jgi:hypothetical protein
MQAVLLTLAAWGSWQAMETLPDYSLAQNVLHFGGYLLVGLALAAFYLAFRNQQS